MNRARFSVFPPFIIDQIRRREQRETEQRRRSQKHEQPRLEIPVEVNRPAPEPVEDDDQPVRGVVILDLG